MQLNIKFHAILPISFCAIGQQNLCHAHFVKIVKSCTEHPKTSKSVKNWKSKIFTIPIISSDIECIEESKKIKIKETLTSMRSVNISRTFGDKSVLGGLLKFCFRKWKIPAPRRKLSTAASIPSLLVRSCEIN